VATESAEVDVVVEVEGPVPVDLARLTDLLLFALATLGADGHRSIAVVLTDDARLRGLHRDYLGIDEETDVMTFPHGDDPGGDIVISVDRAAEQAPDYGHGTQEEIDFLAVHGVLHLCGWSDETPTQREEMLAMQAKIIDVFRAGRVGRGG
jgi:rRNA maturation RNase YbeY